ncbi:MAG: DUF885 domain-containing protein [Thermoplasmata archaeon]
MTNPSTPTEFDALEQRTIDHLFELYPGYAVSLGLHRYDGRLPLSERATTDRWLADSASIERALSSVDPAGLPEGRAIDRLLLQLLLAGARFDLDEIGEFDRNPMVYFGGLSLTSYIVRDYAPVAQRVDAMVRILHAVPAYLDGGRRRLRPALPRPFVTLALSMGSGLPSHFREAEAFARTSSTALGERLARARTIAEEAVTAFLERLRAEYLPRADEKFALGPAMYQRLLYVREGLEIPFAEVERRGRADLERNQRRLEQISRESGRSISQLFDRLYADHPSAPELIPTARSLVDGARQFVEDHRLVTIPEGAVVRVEETPEWGRSLSTASMESPGPFESASNEGIYYVTPVDSKWNAQQQEEWLRSLNRTMLGNITMHEVYPGHYLQFLRFREARVSLARKVFLSPSFVEGWAHYTEQLAVEEGFGAPGVDAEVAQIHDALLRDARLLVSIGLHTRSMSVAEGTAVFEREAHFEHLPAEREAIRGTYNPEYFCYTLGKLAILEARSKYLRPRFNGALSAFHDTLLGFGCPPIGLFDRLFAEPAH